MIENEEKEDQRIKNHKERMTAKTIVNTRGE